MKRVGLFVLLFTLVFSPMSLAKAEVITFSDVKQYKEEINFLAGRKIIGGYGDGTFGPTKSLTRLQAVRMLLKAKGITDLTAPNPNLTDMIPGKPGYEEVAKAVQLGIISGKTAKNGTRYFDPGNHLTRGQMAKVIVEADKLPIRKTTVFSDVLPSNGFHDYISTLAAERITGGYEDGTYRPSNNVSRQHFAVFVARMLNDEFKPTTVNKAPSYLVDKTKTYVMETNFFGAPSTQVATYAAGINYKGVSGWDLWKVTDNGEVTYIIETENASGSFRIWCDNLNGITCSDAPYTQLKYPLYVGQKWEDPRNEFGETDTYTVISTNRTVKTKAGTFNNVVEVRDTLGWTYYYAPNVGGIKVVAGGVTISELVQMK